MQAKSSKNWPDSYLYPYWLPNWREETEYSRITGYSEYRLDEEKHTVEHVRVITSKAEYAWEFLRRNPSYQAEYKTLIELCESEGVTEIYKKSLGLNIFPMDGALPVSLLFHAELYRTLRKWGLGYYLLDPSNDVHVTAPLDGVQRLGNDIYTAVHVEPFPLQDDKTKTEPIPIDGGIIPTEKETFWLFDISLPVEPQLKRAKQVLKGFQERGNGKKIQACKTEPNKFKLYLRILDADASGADDREIMSVLFPDQDMTTYHDSKGKLYDNVASHRNPGRDNLKNCRKAAYYLRDLGYRLLF